MKRFGWGFGSSLAGALLAVMTMAHPTQALAQNATVHGHVQSPLAQPVTGPDVSVKMSTDRSPNRKYTYTFPLDANGDYKGADIKPGTYVVFVFQADKSLDFTDNVIFKKGDDKQLDFDMTREEYMSKLPPEMKKQIEDLKAKNAAIIQANGAIKQVNDLLTQARADIKAGNFDPAVTGMKQATAAKPDEAVLWLTLGDAQTGAAEVAAKAAKTAGKPITDPDVQAKYGEAIVSYKKVLELNAASKKPSVETAGAAQNQLGTVYGKMGDGKNALAAYDEAAKVFPANAAMNYYNEAANLYNAGNMDDSLAAAEKAIATDPKNANAYYIKGQSLIPKASVDPATQKITAPPGCVEAYQQYLALAPDGPHAEEVKQILAGIGAEIKSSYKADTPSSSKSTGKKK